MRVPDAMPNGIVIKNNAHQRIMVATKRISEGSDCNRAHIRGYCLQQSAHQRSVIAAEVTSESSDCNRAHIRGQ